MSDQIVAAGSIYRGTTMIEYDAQWFDFGEECAADGASENVMIAVVEIENGDLESALAGYSSAPVHVAEAVEPVVDWTGTMADEMYDAQTAWMA